MGASQTRSSFDLHAHLEKNAASASNTVLHPGTELQGTHDVRLLKEQFRAEYTAWHKSGTIRSPSHLSASDGGRLDAFAPCLTAEPAGSLHSNGWVNPTILQPHTGRYNLHYGSDPFEPFLPLSDTLVLESISKLEQNEMTACGGEGSSISSSCCTSKSSNSGSISASGLAGGEEGDTGGLLTYACITLMARAAAAAHKRMLSVPTAARKKKEEVSLSSTSKTNAPQLAGANTWAGQGNVTVVIHRGDALALCLGGSSSNQLGGINDTSSSLDAAAVFDVIHTSNISDYVSLANVLLATRPRLNTLRPRSCIYTQSMLWSSLTNTQRAYLSISLCGAAELYPSLYGLRLSTDLDHGRPMAPQPFSQGSNPRTLKWIRADRAVLPSTLQLGLSEHAADSHDSITPALLSMVRLCCHNNFSDGLWLKERIGLCALTPWTLGLMLAQAGTRWRWSGPMGPMGTPLPVPHHCSLSLKASLLSYSPRPTAATAEAGGPTPVALQCAGKMVLDMLSPSLRPPVATPLLRLVVMSLASLILSPCGRRSAMLKLGGSVPHHKPFSLYALDVPLHKELQQQMAKPPAGMHFFDCITATACTEHSSPHSAGDNNGPALLSSIDGVVGASSSSKSSSISGKGGDESNLSSCSTSSSSGNSHASVLESARLAQLDVLRLMGQKFLVRGEDCDLGEKVVLDVEFHLPPDHGLNLDGSVAVLVDCAQVPPAVSAGRSISLFYSTSRPSCSRQDRCAQVSSAQQDWHFEFVCCSFNICGLCDTSTVHCCLTSGTYHVERKLAC